MSDRLRLMLGTSLTLVALIALLFVLRARNARDAAAGIAAPRPTATATTAPTPTPGPLVPTLPPGLPASASATMTPGEENLGPGLEVATAPSPGNSTPPAGEHTPLPGDPGRDDGPAPVPQDRATPQPVTQRADLSWRIGVCVPPLVPVTEDAVEKLGFGWYLQWQTQLAPQQRDKLQFAQMVRVQGTRFEPERADLVPVLRANPGTLWLIGNEPDVPWQDNSTPEEYAAVYHQLYTFIKSQDPKAQVAIGGVSQATPLRLLYLDRVLAAYEASHGVPMPVDVWNVHAFVLREQRDSWGVAIPPGFDVQDGMLYSIDDHDNLEIFRQQILDFRRWMSAHGQRDKPLIVTEYGVLMPEGYGFPPEQVADFLTASFDFFLNARDPEIGFPADDNRLVQRFAWFSLQDRTYPTGNLIDPATGELTIVGQAFADYVRRAGS